MMKVNKYLKSQAFLIIIGLTFFTPSVVKNLKFRFIKNALSIHVHNYEPPKLAFQEAIQKTKYEDVADVWKEIDSKPSINLNEIQSQRKKWNPAQEVSTAKVQVSEMKFTHDEIQKTQTDNSWINQLPQQLQKRVQLAEAKSEILEQDWSQPSWKDFAANIIQENSPTSKSVQTITRNGTPNIQPGRPGQATVYGQTPDGKKITRDQVMTAGVSLAENESPAVFKITGQVRLLDGLALGDRQITIRHFEEGIPKETAVIDLHKGTFEINVENKSGSLLAELTEASGEIIASGKELLNTTTENIDLNIKDQNIFAGTFYNFNKSPEILMSDKINSMRGQKAEFLLTALQTEDQTDIAGSFKVKKISENSATILRAKAAGFSETMMTMTSGTDKNIPIFPETLIQALRSIVNEDKKFQSSEMNGSVVWGQIIFDGKPMQGMSARIMNHDEIPAVYMNGWIPDIKAHETNQNGYFFFTEVPKGMQTIIIERNGIYVTHANVEVDDLTTSVTVVEASLKNKSVSMKVFDIFTGEPIQAEIQMQSLPELQTVLGQKDLTLPKLNRMSFGYVQNQDEEYFPTQFQYFDSDEYIHIPMMKKQTLANLAVAAKISNHPDTGIIIGTVPEDDFEVYLSHEESYEKSNILYFDANGNRVDHGTIGGGFILFNVPPKTQSVVVISAKTNMVHTKLIPVEPNTTSSLGFHF